jgi:ubiquinone/menaquinone biosynthesis C-methylase UbiE
VVRNYFEPSWVAPYYARGRPDVHARVAARIGARLGAGGKLGRALDVGCGTGLSTAALGSVAAAVVGVDPSAPMLALAPRRPGLAYVQGRAEELPLAGGSFDLAAVACAFHWCDRDALADGLRRLLRPDGWVVVYHSTFYGQSPASDELADCLKGSYYPELPLPPTTSPTIRSPTPCPASSASDVSRSRSGSR